MHRPPLGGDEHLTIAEPYRAGDVGRGADFVRYGAPPDLEAIANQNDAERFSERYAAADHLLVALFKNMQRQHTARKQYRIQRKQGQ